MFLVPSHQWSEGARATGLMKSLTENTHTVLEITCGEGQQEWLWGNSLQVCFVLLYFPKCFLGLLLSHSGPLFPLPFWECLSSSHDKTTGVHRKTHTCHCSRRWVWKISVLFFFKYLFIYLAVAGLSCGRWDLVPWPGIEPGPPAVGSEES